MLANMDEGNSSNAGQVPIAEMSFEQALIALEEIVQKLERGDVPLDQSIDLYERGEALRAACQNGLMQRKPGLKRSWLAQTANQLALCH